MKHKKSLLFLCMGGLASIGAMFPTVSAQTLTYQLDDGTEEGATSGGFNQNSAPENAFAIAESLLTLSDYSSGLQTFDLSSAVNVGSSADYFFVGIFYANGADFSE